MARRDPAEHGDEWRSLRPIRSTIGQIVYTLILAVVVLYEHQHFGLLQWVLFPLRAVFAFYTFNNMIFDLYLFRSQSDDDGSEFVACVRKSTMYSEWSAELPYRVTLATFLLLHTRANGLPTPWAAVILIVMVVIYSRYTIFRPAAVLFLGSSSQSSLPLLAEVQRTSGFYRVVSLVWIADHDAGPGKKSVMHSSRLRLRNEHRNEWRTSIESLARLTKLIVVDTRVSTDEVVYETALALAPGYRDKTILICSDDGLHPALDEVVASDPTVSIPEDRVVPISQAGATVRHHMDRLVSLAKLEWKPRA